MYAARNTLINQKVLFFCRHSQLDNFPSRKKCHQYAASKKKNPIIKSAWVFYFSDLIPPPHRNCCCCGWACTRPGPCSHIRNSRFPLSQTLDSGKAQFSFISIHNSPLLLLLLFLLFGHEFSWQRLGYDRICQVENCFQVASRRPEWPKTKYI